MPAAGRCALLAVCAVLMTVHSARAENRSFADLLAQAKAQAAAGHRWEPPGDNATETIMRMIDLIPTATPAQLSELSVLIESGRPGPLPTASTPNSTSQDRLPQPAAAPPADQPLASPAIAAPASPPVLPVHPGSDRSGQLALGQVAPGLGASSAVSPGPVTPSPSAPGAASPSAVPPSAVSPGAITLSPVTPGPRKPSAVSPSAVSPSTIAPSTIAPGPAAPGQVIPDTTSRAAMLFARGLDDELHGDVSGARRFYSTAAQQGDAAAARNLGRLYDPAYLRRTTLGGIDPDPALARYWYERAVRLGDAEASLLLQALLVR